LLQVTDKKGLGEDENFANSKNMFWYFYVLSPTEIAENFSNTQRFL